MGHCGHICQLLGLEPLQQEACSRGGHSETFLVANAANRTIEVRASSLDGGLNSQRWHARKAGLMWTEVAGQPGVAFWVNEDWMNLMAFGSSDLPCTVRLPFLHAHGGFRIAGIGDGGYIELSCLSNGKPASQ